MTLPYFVDYVIVMTMTFYPSAWTKLTVRPNNVTAEVNQSAYMNCSTTSEKGLMWYRDGNMEVCAGLECFEPYKERFQVENIISTGSWNLVISNVQAEDAGEYRCEEIGFASDQQSAHLIVLERKEKESTGSNSSDGLPYNSTTNGTATSATTNGRMADGIIAAIVICPVVVILALIFIIVWLMKRKKQHRKHMKKPANEDQPLMGDKVYLDHPILIKTIKTRDVEEKNSQVRAVTFFKKEVFVVSENSSKIEVYDAENLGFKCRFTIAGLINPLDMKPCLKNNCLYVVDAEHVGRPGKILKIDCEGNILKQWPMEDSGARLSVAGNGNFIVSLYTNNKFVEYDSDGNKVHEIERNCPCHVILLENRQFLISQGYSDKDELHRVYQLQLEEGETGFKVGSDDERIVEAYGGEKGSDGKMNVPWYMAMDKNGYILVAEKENQRVTLLSPTLKFERILISEKVGLQKPLNMYMDIPSGRLFVTDFKEKAGYRFEGRLLVFKIREPENIQG